MATADLKVLREISDIIARADNYRAGLHETLEVIQRHLRASASAVFVPGDSGESLCLLAAAGRIISGLSAAYHIPADTGLTGLCHQQRKTVIAPQPYRHPRYDARDTGWAENPGAVVAFPLVVGGRCQGVLTLVKPDHTPFLSNGLRFAEAIVPPLAVYVLNAKLAQQEIQAEGEAPPQLLSGPLMFKGKAITQGVVRGKALLIEEKDIFDAIPVEYAADPERELRLFQEALLAAKEDTLSLQKEAASILTEADVSIFYAHLLLLEDPLLLHRIQDALAKGFTLRFSLKTTADAFTADLQKLENELMRERLSDVKDVILRIYQAANRRQKSDAGALPITGARQKFIVVARELFPSQLIRLPLGNLGGIVCEEGGLTSHVAILAKALHIPMVVGIPALTGRVRMDDDVILDCTTGVVYVRPPRDVIEHFQHALRFHSSKHRSGVRGVPMLTADGTSVRISGNISLVSELPLLERYGAMGIGLYRTEFMFMVRAAYPTEDEQYAVFRRVAESCENASVTVRVLDIGGDKALPYVDFGQESNPYLGWRGMRFLLSNPHYFEPHLRAILRATPHGKVNVLLPMITDLDELLEAKAVIAKCRQDLEAKGTPVAPAVQLGIMLEVPAAVWSLESMLPHIDFVSIGTNDLIQYSFAVDRGNAKVARWFRQFHPVVLRMVQQIVQTCQPSGKPVSLCGELAGLPGATPLLLGAGLRFLSMNPWQIPGVRAVLTKVTIAQCEKLFRAAVQTPSANDVEKLVAAFMRTHKLRG